MSEHNNPRKQYFDSDGARICYAERGEGAPVIWIHGFSANIDDPIDRRCMDTLSKSHRVIGVDCRGHGMSQKSRRREDYGQAMVNDVVGLLDHLEIDRAHIVGRSMGGTIALNVVARYPKRVRTAVLLGNGGLDGRLREALDQTAKSLAEGNGLSPLISYMTQRSLDPEQCHLMSRDILEGQDIESLTALIRAVDKLETHDEMLRCNPTPILAIVGQNDPSRVAVIELEKVLPHLKVVVLKGVGHSNLQEHPDFANLIASFLVSKASEGRNLDESSLY